MPSQRTLSFLTAEGAAVLVTPSPVGDAGTIFVADASVPAPRPSNREAKQFIVLVGIGFRKDILFGNAGRYECPLRTVVEEHRGAGGIRLSSENYGRLVRMIKQGEQLRMAVELQVKFYEADPMAYNTIAEIPGSDLKDQIVMVGDHLDSWQAGTGATDNGAGVAAAMEAVRSSRRWSCGLAGPSASACGAARSKGLLGSRAYVKKHFGEYADPNPAKAPKEQKVAATSSAKDPGKSGAANKGEPARVTSAGSSVKRSMKSSLFTSTSTTAQGKIRGVYLQGNEGERPIFRSWLKPFRDLGGYHHAGQHLRHRPPVVRCHRFARLPVHPGSARLLQPHASFERGRLRARRGRRLEASRNHFSRVHLQRRDGR